MNRGPLALFGAIVAVGLGPAMWLGAQFGTVAGTPARPPAVVGEQHVSPDRLAGGTGAGAEATGDSVINATPQSAVVPRTRSTTPSPSATTSRFHSPKPSRSSASPEPSESTEPTTPPVESTTQPTAPETAASSPAAAAPPTSGDGLESVAVAAGAADRERLTRPLGG
jgi:hypothetical protein